MLGLLCFILSTSFMDAINLKSDVFVLSHNIPQYLEANQTFSQAKLYVQNNLPKNVSDSKNVTDNEITFSGLVAILGGLVQVYTVDPKHYQPIDLLQGYDKYGRNNYTQVVEATNKFLEDASNKVTPIINLLNSLCVKASYVDCDKAVDAAVRSNPYTYYMPARLFVHLGKISKNIMKNLLILDKIINNDEVVSYLSVHANDRDIMKLIKNISKAYVIMKRMETFS
ncbi:unnamed protein product [Euphydryas editha]|uniref:Uncharacterized protein n=1 Tax=Euphydryas editha TaxID=104508 RepID=A0AAU9UQH7_EUPED|nr:unnamed protein product [Euphydryas editha]